MGHELTEHQGVISFVYNEERGYPWHRLGTPVKGFLTMDQALEASHCDDYVSLEPLYAAAEHGPEGRDWLAFDMDHLRAVVSDYYGAMGVVGGDYHVQQCSDMMGVAWSIVGISDDEAAVDTCGRLGKHAERFFAHIEFPEMVVDPNGIADVIRRGLFVGTSFDGSMANIIGLSNVREVCANTVRYSLGQLKQAIKVKHTLNAQERMQIAAASIGYAAAAEQAMIERAEEMLRIDGDKAIVAAGDALWPVHEDLKAATHKRRLNIRNEVAELYLDGPTNAPLVGRNGWGAYNAVTEWLDYARPVKRKGGAEVQTNWRVEQTLIDPDSDVNKMKMRAADAIFALAA